MPQASLQHMVCSLGCKDEGQYHPSEADPQKPQPLCLLSDFTPLHFMLHCSTGLAFTLPTEQRPALFPVETGECLEHRQWTLRSPSSGVRQIKTCPLRDNSEVHLDCTFDTPRPGYASQVQEDVLCTHRSCTSRPLFLLMDGKSSTAFYL